MPELKEYIVEDSCSCLEDGQLNIYGEEEPDVVEKSVWDNYESVIDLMKKKK